MCDQHSNVLVDIANVEPRGHLGTKRGIDGCIADLVRVLNENGYGTLASCCGHGTHYGSIALQDGKWIVLMDDKHFRAMDTAVPMEDGES